MRHRVVKHSFGRKSGPRKALIKGLVDALVEHERIKTTLPKAKELRRFVERAITKAKTDTVHSKRIVAAKYPNKATVTKLFSDIGPRFKTRPGGYTRILKLGKRLGDSADMVYIELVDYNIEAKAVDTEALEASKRELASKRAKAHKKTLRKIQNKSRRINRK